MKVGIIGAGFGGLAAGYKLAKQGVGVTIFEADDKPGGLAIGLESPKWEWSLEKHYHHWFTNDYAILALAGEMGHKVITVRPKTSTFIGGGIYQLDSPLSLLMFEKLSFWQRLRTGLVLAYFKFTPSWRSLEGITAEKFLKKWNGERAWDVLWKPLFEKKFAKFAHEIPAAWFWARIKKRTSSLAYPEGGFLSFAQHLDKLIRQCHGNVLYKTPVESLSKDGNKFRVETGKHEYLFDKVICTLPSSLFLKIAKGLPENYVESLIELKGIGTVNLVLLLNKQFLADGTYWLNVNPPHFPFLTVVEHTNFMNKKYYGDKHIVYIGNYLQSDHRYFKKEAVDLLRDFYPYLKTINPKFDKDWIESAYLFKAAFAQPIIPLNYSEKVPSFETPISGLYLCNIQQVYPWDRGTNYAVENGERVADIIIKEG